MYTVFIQWPTQIHKVCLQIPFIDDTELHFYSQWCMLCWQKLLKAFIVIVFAYNTNEWDKPMWIHTSISSRPSHTSLKCFLSSVGCRVWVSSGGYCVCVRSNWSRRTGFQHAADRPLFPHREMVTGQLTNTHTWRRPVESSVLIWVVLGVFLLRITLSYMRATYIKWDTTPLHSS